MRTQPITEMIPSVYVTNADTLKPSTSSGASSAPSPVSPSPKSPAISIQASSHPSGSPGVAGSASAVIPHGIAIALLSIILTIGSLVDKNLPPAPHNAQAEHYYQLTQAALTTIPSVYGTETSPSVLERAPSIATVQTLSLMAIYQGMAMKDDSIESAWTLMSIATKLAQSVSKRFSWCSCDSPVD